MKRPLSIAFSCIMLLGITGCKQSSAEQELAQLRDSLNNAKVEQQKMLDDSIKKEKEEQRQQAIADSIANAKRLAAVPTAKEIDDMAWDRRETKTHKKYGLKILHHKTIPEGCFDSETIVCGRDVKVVVKDDFDFKIIADGDNAFAILTILTTDHGTTIFFKNEKDAKKFAKEYNAKLSIEEIAYCLPYQYGLYPVMLQH